MLRKWRDVQHTESSGTLLATNLMWQFLVQISLNHFWTDHLDFSVIYLIPAKMESLVFSKLANLAFRKIIICQVRSSLTMIAQADIAIISLIFWSLVPVFCTGLPLQVTTLKKSTLWNQVHCNCLRHEIAYGSLHLRLANIWVKCVLVHFSWTT